MIKLKNVGELIRYDTHWEVPNGNQVGTIIGYDLGHSKYKVAKHSVDGYPMVTVIDWIFVCKNTKKTKYAVTIVNTETGECRAYLTDHYENADERVMLADEEGGEIVFINEFEIAPINPNVQKVNP